MRNPISNAIRPITKRDLVSCKRCGCPDLAWTQFKSGKWALVETRGSRPLWRGDGPAPEGLWAVKFAYHRCDTYRETLAEAQRVVALQADCSLLGGKEVGTFLGNVASHIFQSHLQTGGTVQDLGDVTHSTVKAMLIVSEASAKVRSL